MLKRIAWVAVIGIVGFAIWYAARQRSINLQDTDGAVICVQNCDTPEQAAAYSRQTDSAVSDGTGELPERNTQAHPAAPTASPDPPLNDSAESQHSQNQIAPEDHGAGSSMANGTSTANGTTTAPVPDSSPAVGRSYSQPSAAPGAFPQSDSQGPNAPDELRFSGSGAYQWYRQGNLTWRVNTVTGRSCIIYATMEEWKKPVVLSHGCGRTT